MIPPPVPDPPAVSPPAPTRPAPPGLLLRATRPDDAEALCALLNLPGFRWGTTQLPFQSPDEVRRRLEQSPPEQWNLVAILDEDLVGSASLIRGTGRRAHVGRIGMGVRDGCTGHGIGTALLAAAIDLADQWLNLHRLELDVVVDNHPALALYRRFGFTVEGTHRRALFRAGRHVDTHSMARLNDPRPPEGRDD